MAKINKLGWIEFGDIISTTKKGTSPTSFERADGRNLTSNITSSGTFRNWVSRDSSSTILGTGFTYDVITGAHAREFPGASYFGGRDKVGFANASMAFRGNQASTTTSGSDLLIGNRLADTFIFTGVSGYDFLDGGAGIDRMIVRGTSSNFYNTYDVQRVSTLINAGGKFAPSGKRTDFIQIKDKSSGEYTLLANIEQIHFMGDNRLMKTWVGNYSNDKTMYSGNLIDQNNAFISGMI